MKKYRFIILSIIIILTIFLIQEKSLALSAAPDIDWVDTGFPSDFEGAVMENTPDKGVIIGGYSFTFQDGKMKRNDVEIVKKSSKGEIEWKKDFPVEGQFSRTRYIVPTKDGGYLIFCNTYINEFIDEFSRKEIPTGIYVIRIDSYGNKLWDNKLNISYLIDYFIEVSQSNDFVIARTESETLILTKYNSNGIQEWEKKYNDNQLYIGSLSSTNDGGYIIAGSNGFYLDKIKPGTTIDIPDSKAFVMKVDIYGNQQWIRYIDKSHYDICNAVTEWNGGYILGGSSFGKSIIGGDLYLEKIDYNGNVIWEKKIPNLANLEYYDKGVNIKKGENGNIILISKKQDVNKMPFLFTEINEINQFGDIVWSIQENNFNEFRGFQTSDYGAIFVLNSDWYYNKNQIEGYMPPILVNIKGGTYNKKQKIILNNFLGDIYYTTDDSIPNENSKKYISTIEITKTQNLKYIRIFRDGKKSIVHTQKYIIDTVPPKLKILAPTNNSKTYNDSVNISGVSEQGSIIKINGVSVKISSNGNFTKKINLRTGINNLIIVASDEAGNKNTINYKIIKQTKPKSVPKKTKPSLPKIPPKNEVPKK